MIQYTHAEAVAAERLLKIGDSKFVNRPFITVLVSSMTPGKSLIDQSLIAPEVRGLKDVPTNVFAFAGQPDSEEVFGFMVINNTGHNVGSGHHRAMTFIRKGFGEFLKTIIASQRQLWN